MGSGDQGLFWPVDSCALCPSRCPGLPDRSPATSALPWQAFNTCLILSADEAGCGVGRGVSELREALGAALPEAQRPWEWWAGVLGPQDQGHSGRLSAQGWGRALGLQTREGKVLRCDLKLFG